jgi:hypothetical protein
VCNRGDRPRRKTKLCPNELFEFATKGEHVAKLSIVFFEKLM